MAMKKKGYAKGGAMKKKPVAMSKGSKLKMVEKGGKKVPFFAADGVGKMKKGGATKKKGMAKGGVVKKGLGGTVQKKTPKPAANFKEVGKYIPKHSQNPVDKRPAGKLLRPATKAEVEKFRADERRKQRKKSGQLDQAKKKAKKTAVKAMGGGMMKKKGMAKGGAMKKKGYAKGGVVKKGMGGSMKKKGMAKGGVARGSGAARPQKFTRNG